MLLWYIYITLIGLNLITAFARRKYLSAPMKILSGLLLWSIVIEIWRWETDDKILSGILTHLNLIVEVLFLFAYYYILLEKKKRIFLYGGLTFFGTALFVTWNVQPLFFQEQNYLDAVFVGVCMALWCGLFFHELIQKPLQYSLKSDGNFWVNCANILFYPGTLLLFGLGSYMEHVNPELRQSLKPLNYALNLTLYGLYLVAFCRDRKQQIPANPPIFTGA